MGSLRTFLVKAGVLAVLVIACNEAAWRALRVPTTFRDTPALWSKVRRECDGSTSKVVLIGSSRFQAGLDTEAMSRTLPDHRFYQLSMHASGAMPVLEDLAQDVDFRGTVIAEFLPPWLWADRETWSQQPVTALVEYAHREHFGNVIENELQMFGEERFAFFNPSARFWLAAGQLWRTGFFQPPMTRIDRHRNAQISLRAGDVKTETEKWMALERDIAQKWRPAGSALLFRQVAGWTRQIQARGGSVIFFQMAVDGPVRDFEDQTYPADRYFDPFSHSLSIPLLSYKNYPELANYRCPDGSHLDAADAPRFSEAFARILERERLLR